ncbi:beta-N-acetylhexosaminidase family protein [Tenggerimyces flavus]|uniref:Beta-N-acetylglucosaminidase domain-containing protein n=1 Tax=Tenggerimyces flavus TaxID=1708749 RepID=A0ABV7Y7Z4_9ACTN|nr:beta-N-acetylglucosaminidase domain-containing protein [Tenggerimyces flavus]MBM7785698.1 hyaluronoglucosaminidase [Tenggerimyces flavus]
MSRICPTPQEVVESATSTPIPSVVAVINGPDTDPAARRVLEATLRGAGAEVRHVRARDVVPNEHLLVYLGGPAENPTTARILQRLNVKGPEDLPAEGYVLASGRAGDRSVVTLAGADPTGTYYAAHTFRQLLDGTDRLPSIAIRDWPRLSVRGAIEGFYGSPWSDEDRADQLAFYGAHKLNTYQYSPKDDPYLRERWRDPYPDTELAQLASLVAQARDHHVTFTYALSPGLSVCYSSNDDLAALVAKFEQLYAIGVRSFNVPLDDISYTDWNCAADEERFGTGGGAAGTAQAYLLNRVVEAFVAQHDDVSPLQLFGHRIMLWDNYPVNDYQRGRLALAPYTGRQPRLADQLVGVVANPMNQAAASKLGLYSVADYAWNPERFDPQQSWQDSLDEYAKGDENVSTALRMFCDTQHWLETITGVDAPELAAAIEAFWPAWLAKDDAAITTFERHVVAFAAAPDVLKGGLEPAFATETRPWLTTMTVWGEAMATCLDLLRAHRESDAQAVRTLTTRLDTLVSRARSEVDPNDPSVPVKVADGVADRFVRDVLTAVR